MEKTLTRPLVIAAGYFCALLGLVVILGWVFQVSALIQLLPNFAPMPFNASLSFLICGLALVLLERGYTFTVQSLAALLIVLSVLTMAEGVFGIDLKINGLFIGPFRPAGAVLNRMTCFAALGFLAAGVAFLVVEIREISQRSRVVYFLGLGLSILGGATLASYLFGSSGVMETDHISKMTAHASIGFLVLGLGLQFYAATTNNNGEFTPNAWHPLIIGLNQYSIQKKFFMLFLTLFIGLLVLAGATAKRFQENTVAWTTQQNDVEPRQQYLFKMKDLFGYGGGVFYFKL